MFPEIISNKTSGFGNSQPANGKQSTSANSYSERLKRICRVCPQPRAITPISGNDYPNSIALKYPEKNRYKDILPNNSTRVILKKSDKDGYINASWYKDRILAQAPLESTISDFWLMAFQSDATIVCLTNEIEKGKVKSSNYWNGKIISDGVQNGEFQFKISDIVLDGPDLQVKSVGEPIDKFSFNDYKIIESEFLVTVDSIQKLIKRIYFQNWPDMGVCDVGSALKLIELIPKNSNVIVHCSAGVGRTGTVVMIEHFINEFNLNNMVPSEDDIDAEIQKLRKIRPGSVQTADQRELISKAIFKYIDNEQTKPMEN
jgi:protein tyrosine phosphatase